MDDLSGVDKPLYINLKNIFSSQSAGEKRANSLFSSVTGPFGRAVGGLMLATSLSAAPMTALANDGVAEPVQNSATVQTAALQNPYISACNGISDFEFKAACTDAANGMVVILRNPNEVSDLARDIFLKSVNDEYNESIPVNVRDTGGSTTVFLFDKHMQIDRDMLVNGSLLHVLGKKYPEKVVALSGLTPVDYD